jgi:DNA-binding GntR family transcriptional regulator
MVQTQNCAARRGRKLIDNFTPHSLPVAGSRWLMTISAQLFEAAERYRNLGRAAGKSRAQADEHRPIVEAALAYNADLATGLLTRHYQTTAELVETVLTQGGAPARQ